MSKILIIGVGGGGINAVKRMKRLEFLTRIILVLDQIVEKLPKIYSIMIYTK